MKLADAVHDFLNDKEALAGFIKANRQTQKATGGSTLITPSLLADQPHSPLQPTYVHRPELEDAFSQLVNDGTKLIVFVGQPGMGKTRLAEEVTRDPTTNAPAPFIRVSEGRISATDVQSAHSSCGIPYEASAGGDPSIGLAALLSMEHAPLFVVLDNLENSDELGELLPRNIKSTVIATCRRKGDAPHTHTRFITVGKMTRPEASELIQNHIETLSENDARYVASQLGDYPLVLQYVAGIHQYQRKPIREFCRVLRAEASTIAQDTRTEEGSTLLAVLRHTVSTIAARDALAMELLVCSVFLGGPPSFYSPFLMRYLGSTSNGVITDLRLAQAFRVLHDFSLLEVSYPWGWKSARIHSFTAEILREEFSDRLPEVMRRTQEIASVEGDDINVLREIIRRRGEGHAFLTSPAEGGTSIVFTYSGAGGQQVFSIAPVRPGEALPIPSADPMIGAFAISIGKGSLTDEEVRELGQDAAAKIQSDPRFSEEIDEFDVEVISIALPEGNLSEEETEKAIGKAIGNIFGFGSSARTADRLDEPYEGST